MTKTAELNEKSMQAFQLRKAGKSYPEIARLMNIAVGSAYNYANRGRETYYDQYPDEREHTQHLELARLDDMTDGIFEQAKSGDPKAIDALIKIMDRRAKFLGLDAPARQQIETKSSVSAEDLTDDELAAIIKAGGN